MPNPTAFISPRNYLPDATPAGWSGTGTTLIAADAATDGRVDTVTRRRSNYAASGNYDVIGWDFFNPSAYEVPVQVVALLNHTLPAGAVVTFTLVNAAASIVATGSVVVTEAVGDYYQNNLIWPLSSEVQVQNASVLIDSGYLPDDHIIDIGEVWAGQLWTPEAGIVFETPLGFIDPSLQQFSGGSQGFAAARAVYREVTLEFPALTEAELLGASSGSGLSLAEIMGMTGRRAPVLCGPTRESQYLMDRTAICGMITSDGIRARPLARKSGARVWRTDLTVREIR